MNGMPVKLREELSDDPRYKVCSLKSKECRGRVEWHHNFKYQGCQIQAEFSIISLCKFHHDNARGKFRDLIDWICLSRANEIDIRLKYPKAYDEWMWKLKYLTKKYGKFKEKRG